MPSPNAGPINSRRYRKRAASETLAYDELDMLLFAQSGGQHCLVREVDHELARKTHCML